MMTSRRRETGQGARYGTLRDEALGFRLVFSSGYRPDPAAKGALGLDCILAHGEMSLLRRQA
jgi:hypothetical protein